MTNKKLSAETEFVRAARSNNYAHIELADNMALVTDVHNDGKFQPYVTIESNDIEKSDVENQLDDFPFIDYKQIHIQSQEGVNIDFADIEQAEFLDPRTDTPA